MKISERKKVKQAEIERLELREALRRCCLAVSPTSTISEKDTHGCHCMTALEVEIGMEEFRAQQTVLKWLQSGKSPRKLIWYIDRWVVYEFIFENKGDDNYWEGSDINELANNIMKGKMK